MRIYHIATRADWERARAEGSYATSTRGRTLAEEGFIHASHRDQVPVVFGRFYRDVREPLLLLTIDTDRLGVPWREEEVATDQGSERYPHIFGPMPVAAVVSAVPMNRSGGTESFTSLFVKEMAWRIIPALILMVLIGAGVQTGSATGVGALPGGLAGLGLGVLIWWWVARRR